MRSTEEFEAFFLTLCWAVFPTFSESCGYFSPSVLERFRMDAIMLQEKLVERLLCPRVRTARQKVKSCVCVTKRALRDKEKAKNRKSSHLLTLCQHRFTVISAFLCV